MCDIPRGPDPSAPPATPDILDCLANLSSDEVFTPPKLANQVLDLLPADIWSDPAATFLDPACKSGVFLRECARRLNVGLARRFPDRRIRLNHIFGEQLFGLPITQLTALMTRRTLYCSADASGRYSVAPFADQQGNVRFTRLDHLWGPDDRCTLCGAARGVYDRDESHETHAYSFIHAANPETIFDMKFDVIISNPPFQLGTGSATSQATPLYHKFVLQALKASRRYVAMIIPSRWFAGGMGLDSFREIMLHSRKLRVLVDYSNAKDCFPFCSIGGGYATF